MWRTVFRFLQWVNKQITYRNRLEAKVDDIMRRTLRLEIFEAIRRKDTHTVYELHDIYKQNGWNSYVSEMVENYKKANRLNKRSKKC